VVGDIALSLILIVKCDIDLATGRDLSCFDDRTAEGTTG
jgi:hypothetical protein